MAWIKHRLLGRIDACDVAYMWLTSPPEVIERVHAKGAMVVREMINCTLDKRRQELTKAYAALGLPGFGEISDSDIERERQEILASDAVFCPNPFVKQSVMDYGLPEERCIEASFGWDPARLEGDSRVLGPAEGFSLAFVGTIDIRKGVPWLLEAWVRSGVKGRLLLSGWLDKRVAERYAAILAREDVICLGYVDDVASVYRSADAFAFPTWEEGGPLVTLEAMAQGLPSIVTPMGTSGAFGAGDEIGILVPPGDVDALAEAIRRLAQDGELRRHMGERARIRAQEYTWDLVVARRKAGLLQRRCQWLEMQR